MNSDVDKFDKPEFTKLINKEDDKGKSKNFIQSSLLKLNISPIDKCIFVPLSEVDVKFDDLVKDVYKVNEYETIITTIRKSIDEYYLEIDNFDDYPYFKGKEREF